MTNIPLKNKANMSVEVGRRGGCCTQLRRASALVRRVSSDGSWGLWLRGLFWAGLLSEGRYNRFDGPKLKVRDTMIRARDCVQQVSAFEQPCLRSKGRRREIDVESFSSTSESTKLSRRPLNPRLLGI